MPQAMRSLVSMFRDEEKVMWTLEDDLCPPGERMDVFILSGSLL